MKSSWASSLDLKKEFSYKEYVWSYRGIIWLYVDIKYRPSMIVSLFSILSLIFVLFSHIFHEVFPSWTSMKSELLNFEILSQSQRKRQNNRKRSDKHFAGAANKINIYAI